MPVDPSPLSSAQKNSVLLGINMDNLDETQTSLAKNILPGDGSTTEEEDADLDLNISGDEFDSEFPGSQESFQLSTPTLFLHHNRIHLSLLHHLLSLCH